MTANRRVRDVSRAIPDLIAAKIGAISVHEIPFPREISNGLEQAQIQLDSVQIELGFAPPHRSLKYDIRIRYIMEYFYI
jgi:hypothetical protein